MIPRLIGICGYARHGKNTVAEMINGLWGHVPIAFADKIRECLLTLDPYIEVPTQLGPQYRKLSEVISIMGWEDAKATIPDVRRLLQRFGTEVGRGIISESLWIDLHERASSQYESVSVPDLRFPNEEQSLLSRGAVLIRVHDPRKEDNGVGTRHESEQYVEKIQVHHLILNDGTLKDLEAKVIECLRRYEP
jgi:hypothetical protein